MTQLNAVGVQPTHETRRWCKGDGEWTSWQPVPPDKLAERRADPTFEVRPIAGVNRLHEGRDSQHVLKAEGASPDATDRENCANASPDGGPMGAGQAAAAAPIDVQPSAWPSARDVKRCPACNGNDADAPCAFPEGGQPGCLRDARIAGVPDAPKTVDGTSNQGGSA